MAKKIEIRHIDDLDKTSEADVTRHIAVDGVAYKIDLSAKHSEELDDLLKPILDAATRAGRALPPITYLATGYQGKRERNAPAELEEARAYAKKHGLHVNSKGRVERCVMSAYRTNNPDMLKQSKYYVPEDAEKAG